MNIPNEPAMLLSFINLKLRDNYSSLDVLCEDLQLSAEDICKKLSTIDYEYDRNTNQFV